MLPGGKGSETVNRLKLKKRLANKLFPEKIQSKTSCYEPDCSMHDMGMQTTGPGIKGPKYQQINMQHQRHTQKSEREIHMQNADDTYSYTSCSLKKMIASESPKIMLSLIVVVGALSVILLLKFVCYPATISELPELLENRERRSNDAVNDGDRKPWETSDSKLVSELSGLTGEGTKESNLHGGGEEYPDYLSPDLSSILDPIKVNEGYGSNKLRDFYRKLLKTDIQIKNLKKGFANIKRGNIDLSDPNTPRLKRSIKFVFTTRKPTRTTSLNKLSRTKYGSSDNWKTIKETGKNVQGCPEEAPNVNVIDNVKIIIKEDDPVHELVTKKPKKLKKKKNHCKWLHDIFGRETGTQNRRLLQNNYDEDDEDVATEDYEELTKEPWERKKRTVSPMEIIVNPDLKPYLESSTPLATPLDNEQINYLIDAALKMKKNKIGNMEHSRKYTNVIVNKENTEDNSNYNELVGMAQAYSDYGVLDNKKEIFENNLAHENTFKLLTSKKPDRTVKWHNNNGDNPHGQRIKLKSSDTSKTTKPPFLKMLRLKMFPKLFNVEIKNVDLEATKMPSNIEVDKTSNSTHVTDTTATWTKSNQKTTQKRKERNVLFSGHRRSLKSVEIDESKYEATATDSDVEPDVSNAVQLENNEVNSVKHFNNNIAFENKNEINSLINETDNKTIVSVDQKNITLNVSEGALKHNTTNALWGLGEIFNMLADLFMFLSSFDTHQEDNGYRFLYDFVKMLNPNYSQNTSTSSPKNGNNTTASVESKIGYRSRSLLSFEETTVVIENFTTSTTSEKNINESYVVASKK